MIIVIAAALGGGDGGGSDHGSSHAGQAKHGQTDSHVPKTYEVQSGDTLTSIAHKTGVPVSVILKLNPGIDPQILISGEQLKLK